MRELLLILGAACIASLPFVAFSEWHETASHPQASLLWGDDLRQANSAYTMPKLMAASAKMDAR